MYCHKQSTMPYDSEENDIGYDGYWWCNECDYEHADCRCNMCSHCSEDRLDCMCYTNKKV